MIHHRNRATRRYWLAMILVLSLVGVPAVTAGAQGTPATPSGGAWMDAPQLPVWNQPGAGIPAAPPAQGPEDPNCRQAGGRDPETPEDQAVAGAGWGLIGEFEGGWGVRLITGNVGYDGMCRPMGYQVFAFLNGRYVGTLSPTPMSSRTDGSLTSTSLGPPLPGNAGPITAVFSRYTDQDALCCPSRTTTVQYRIQLGPQGNNVIAGRAISSPTTPPAAAQAAPAAPGTFNADFEGVRFTFSLTLSPYVKWQAYPAVPLPAQPEPGLGGAAPQHLQFSFVQGPDSDTPTCDALRQAHLCVYPVAGLRALDPSVAQSVTDLQALLATRPAAPTAIPVFPVLPANQTIRAQVRYLDFQGGSGVRFVTRYAQDASPITNQTVFFAFQGLTADGRHYVSLFWPVDTSSLPNTADEALGGQSYNDWVQQYDAYIARTVQTLNGLAPTAFTPDLSLLDAMLQTLQVDATLPIDG